MPRSPNLLALLPLFSITMLAACDGKAVVETENQRPSAPEVAIGPDDPKTGDDLVAVILTDARDPDGDAVSYTYRWFQDGLPRADLATDTVPAAETARGEEWEVFVTPNDAEADGPDASATAVIGNTPPNLSVVLTPDAPTTDDALSAAATAEDPDGDDVTLTYEWTRDGEPTDVDGAVLPASYTARGESWVVTVEAADDGGAVGSASAGAEIANAAPEVLSVQIGPDAPDASDDLVAQVDADDPDHDTLSYTYTWYVDGAAVQSGRSDTLRAGEAAKNERVSVDVVPYDGDLEGESFSSTDVIVRDSPPTAPVAEITPDPPRNGDDLTCGLAIAATDADGDTIRYTFTWTVDGVAYTGALDTTTTSVVSHGALASNETWQCTVEAEADGQAASSSDSVHLVYTEACDGVDNDGDGDIDEGSVCPCTTYTYRGHAYMICSATETYASTKSFCESYGYHTVKLDSAGEETYIDGKASNYYWIGLEEGSTADSFSWYDGSAATYTDWDTSYAQPDSGAGESCVQVRSGGWHDVVCWTTSERVCESEG